MLTPQIIKAIAAYPERFYVEKSFSVIDPKTNALEIWWQRAEPYEIDEEHCRARLKKPWQTMQFGGFIS